MNRNYKFWVWVAIALWLLFGLSLTCDAQERTNTIYAGEFQGATVAAKVTAAQAACNPNTAIPCFIVIDAFLATTTTGSMPTKCAQCTWIDYRNASPFGVGGGSGDVTGPASSTSGNLPSFNGAGGKTLQDSGIAAASVTKTIASGQTAMRTVAIASAGCDSVLTIAATGTAATDVVTIGFSGDPTAITGYTPATTGTLTVYVYPTANNVNFKVCNSTSASITPGAIALNWRVVR
jgi:hypothetical protein